MNVAPSLNISLSGDIDTSSGNNNVVLNLNPNNHTYDKKDLTIKVGTNNITGYKLTMATPNESTDLIHTEDNTILIPTLDNTYTESTFPVNKWGYQKDHTGNFIPYVSGIKLLENTSATNEDTTTLTFASKIDYNQPAGEYNLALQFVGVTNPNYPYIQDITKTICQQEASSGNMYVMDIRDYNVYTIRYINGNCWMTQDLRFVGDATTSTMTLDSSTTNVNASYTPSNPLRISYTRTMNIGCNSGALWSGDGDDGVPTAWYSYALIGGNSYVSSCTSNISYDLCPAGWRLPNYNEQNGLVAQSAAIQATYNPVANGICTGGSCSLGNGGGYNWSATAYYAPEVRHWNMCYKKSSGTLEMYGGFAKYGMTVRCIAK